VRARTTDGNGAGDGRILFLEPEGLSVVSDIDDTIKVTHVPAGKKTVLRNTFLKAFREAEGMRDRYARFAEGGNVSFHYVSGSPWQLFKLLEDFLVGEKDFPAGTFHMKTVGKNVLDAGGLDSIIKFVRGGDLATLEQKVRQITNLMMNLSGRKFILVGDSGEKDPEVFRAMKTLFPDRVQKIYIRDVLGERLEGMERITGPDVPVALDTSELVEEMKKLIESKAATAPAGEEVGEPKL
jgi:phosphatidate phosphatase APP1